MKLETFTSKLGRLFPSTFQQQWRGAALYSETVSISLSGRASKTFEIEKVPNMLGH